MRLVTWLSGEGLYAVCNDACSWLIAVAYAVISARIVGGEGVSLVRCYGLTCCSMMAVVCSCILLSGHWWYNAPVYADYTAVVQSGSWLMRSGALSFAFLQCAASMA